MTDASCIVLAMTEPTPATPAFRWMTKQEVAARLRVTPQTVRRMARDQRLTEYRNGNIVRFREDEVEALLQPVQAQEVGAE